MKKTSFLFLCFACAAFASPERIGVQYITSSVQLGDQAGNNYKPSNVLDGNLNTVWAAKFLNRDHSITFNVDAQEVVGLVIANGYNKNQKTLENNAQAKNLVVYVNGEPMMEYALQHVNKVGEFPNQEMQGEYIELQSPAKNVKTIKLTFHGAYAGKKWNDMCISEIYFLGKNKEVAVEKTKMPMAQFVDPRDGQSYRTTVINGHTWMAQNLNYNAPGSLCYNNSKENCEIYGRLYDYEMAMSSCPAGWHVPSREEYEDIADILYSGIKSKIGWKKDESSSSGGAEYSPNGSDIYGFTMLPGGRAYKGSGNRVFFYGLGTVAEFFLSDTFYDEEYGGQVNLCYSVFSSPDCSCPDPCDGAGFTSIRCVKD